VHVAARGTRTPKSVSQTVDKETAVFGNLTLPTIFFIFPFETPDVRELYKWHRIRAIR
jgi:hypothetical protein